MKRRKPLELAKIDRTTITKLNDDARIVCGPIDEYICICMPDYIPGGANVLIECFRTAIEIFARKLADCKNGLGRPKPLPLPFSGGFNFDNCTKK
jgi:hypothetical protein